jgi:hypothetical protein
MLLVEQRKAPHSLSLLEPIFHEVKNVEKFTYQPLVDLQDLPQLLQVLDQVPRGVVHQGCVRDALPRPPLVHKDDPVEVWVEEAAVVGRGAGARAPVEEDDRLRIWQKSDFLSVYFQGF